MYSHVIAVDVGRPIVFLGERGDVLARTPEFSQIFYGDYLTSKFGDIYEYFPRFPVLRRNAGNLPK